jgi:translation initiation factor IF-2
VIKTADLSSLKHVKDDIKEAGLNMECGLSLKAYDDIQVGDILESFEEIQVAKTL